MNGTEKKWFRAGILLMVISSISAVLYWPIMALPFDLREYYRAGPYLEASALAGVCMAAVGAAFALTAAVAPQRGAVPYESPQARTERSLLYILMFALLWLADSIAAAGTLGVSYGIGLMALSVVLIVACVYKLAAINRYGKSEVVPGGS